ncbi:MAG TPA: N-6 DNA methylase [Ignavibacteriaceae bacterium]|nr:N-6 DNA methylase [Ignavibacteriaceae bacterium]
MSDNKSNLIKEYFHKVKQANKEHTKKEAFKDLLNRLYGDDKDILRLIDKITLGAETTVLNIPRKDKLHKGSADTLYNKIIIEFENDLKVMLKHAKEQLAGYLLGQFNSGEGYNFVLIASDFITWKIFAPAVDCLDKLNVLKEDELILDEVKSASFILSEKNADEFYYWIDRFLFKEEKQRATLKRIEEAFGYQSYVFIESYRELSNWFQEAKKYGEVQVSYDQWNKFLSVAYGSFDGRENIFLIHSYLSVFSKMLAYSVISNDDYIDDNELKAILDGNIFHKYNIRNFVDNDFYHWVVSDRNFKSLKKVFRLIAQEISSFDFEKVDEDVLKGVYQELIDLDTRHSLGEYYTPDWLCERIVKEFEFKKTDKILDPACGSGSFLRAAIHRIKELNPNVKVEEINEQIYGIDIHPLSVQIAKTTLLLALGKKVISARKPVKLNIILANTLLAHENATTLFGSDLPLYIDKEKYFINTKVLDDLTIFDEGLELCEDLAENTQDKKINSETDFEVILKKKLKNEKIGDEIVNSFFRIYNGFYETKKRGRNGIWKFIVQNSYKPRFLKNKFDYIIGNPPWFTYSSIKNEDYQDLLNRLAVTYEVKPERKANFPHLEIAAIFVAYCNSYYLNENGKLAFVLPRSFISADHHSNTRNGYARGFVIDKIWDLFDVSPLFRVPSCVFFTSYSKLKQAVPREEFEGIHFEGNLGEQNSTLKNAQALIKENVVRWYKIKLGKSSAFSIKKVENSTKINPYKEEFKQGATIVPRTFYFVDLDQEEPPDFNDRIISVKTSEAIQGDAKKPWKGLKFSGMIESKFIFRTALSKSILPFVLYNPALVVLPILIETDRGYKAIRLKNSEELLKNGDTNAAKWFKNNENTWEINRTAKSESMTCNDRLDFQKGLTVQDLNKKYLILYNSSAKDANATIVKRSEIDFEFIVESKTYWYATNNLQEVYYLAGILNSKVTNTLIKDFQTRGLYGERDIHKRILDVYYPKYDNANKVHNLLVEVSIKAHISAKKYLVSNPPKKELTATRLGKYRLDIKKHLSFEMKEIDKLVKKVGG